MPPKPKNKSKGGSGSKEARKRAAAASEAFYRFYGEQYGERWAALQEALMKPTHFGALLNRYAAPDALMASLGALCVRRMEGVELPCVIQEAAPASAPEAALHPSGHAGEGTGEEEEEEGEGGCSPTREAGASQAPERAEQAAAAALRFPPPPRDDNFLLCYYPMDPSSLLAVQALGLQPDDDVLDLCAAPGGKTLAIMQYLAGGQGCLTANDPAPDRRRRLSQVVSDYLPDTDKKRVTVTGYDGTKGWRGHGASSDFDKVLLDAPCSTERHVMHKPSEMATWSTRRSKANADRQASLLHTALDAVRSGGFVVYSTCSLSELENDKVVERVTSKRQDRDELRVLRPNFPFGEATKLGWMILPDATSFGPLYIALLQRS